MSNRYLLMGSGKSVNVMWLDSDGTCEAKHGNKDGSISPTRFHVYNDEKGQRWPVICPNGLEPIEWDRVKVGDNWREELVEFRRALMARPEPSRRSSRPKEDDESDWGKYGD